MPEPKFAAVNDIRLAFYEAGPPTAAPPFVLCHGWPELAFSWRRQIQALSEAGHRVIAPDMRGFGLSPGPYEVEAYDLLHIANDLAGLLDHLGVEKAIFVGHDWGGAAVWRMAMEHPGRVAGVIALNTPHASHAPINPVDIFRKRLGEDFYMVEFQRPEREADRIFAENVEKVFAFFFRGPPLGPGSSRPNLAFHRIVPVYDPTKDTRRKFLGDEEMAVYVETYRRTGFTGGINWYRNIERNWRREAELNPRIEVPCLMIIAEGDVVLPPSAADGMEDRIPDLEKVLIRDCGHWTMQEKPAEVNAAILDWRRRRFG
jgi:microsomal epoxide hydrolase/non-specific protein-tyrosine kinase